MNIVTPPKLLCYSENNFIYFVNDSVPQDFGVGAYPTLSVSVAIDADGETIVFFFSETKQEITRRKFDNIADKNGVDYGLDAATAFQAINTALGVVSTSGGGGSGDATAANQLLQLSEAQDQTTIQGSTLPSIRLSNLDTAAATTQLATNQINGSQVTQDFLLSVSKENVLNQSIIRRVDKNIDIDTTGLPEAVTFLGGAYTGFPISGFGAIQVLSSSAADAGTLIVTFLESQSSTDYQQATFAVNGTTPVNLDINGNPVNAYRVISAVYRSTANPATTFNLGTITVRYIATPAVAFLAIPIGRNISHGAVFTVPQGKKALILPTRYSVNNIASAVLECAMYIRSFNLTTLTYGSPLACFSATVTAGTPLIYDYNGGILIDAGTDIVPIVVLSSTNNVTIEASYSVQLFNA